MTTIQSNAHTDILAVSTRNQQKLCKGCRLCSCFSPMHCIRYSDERSSWWIEAQWRCVDGHPLTQQSQEGSIAQRIQEGSSSGWYKDTSCFDASQHFWSCGASFPGLEQIQEPVRHTWEKNWPHGDRNNISQYRSKNFISIKFFIESFVKWFSFVQHCCDCTSIAGNSGDSVECNRAVCLCKTEETFEKDSKHFHHESGDVSPEMWQSLCSCTCCLDLTSFPGEEATDWIFSYSCRVPQTWQFLLSLYHCPCLSSMENNSTVLDGWLTWNVNSGILRPCSGVLLSHQLTTWSVWLWKGNEFFKVDKIIRDKQIKCKQTKCSRC